MSADPQGFTPRILAFVCNWCTYAGADLAGTSRMKHRPTVRVIRVPCSGRIDPMMVMKAFERGADGVIVSGCHPGDCHYNAGNLVARRRFQVTRHLLEALGLEPGRLHFTWISAAEGSKWAATVDEVTATVEGLGPFRRFRELLSVDPLREPAEASSWKALLPGETEPGTGEDGLEERIQARARELLASEEVDLVIGYHRPDRGDPRPAFFTRAEDAEQLAHGPDCQRGLAAYLSRPEVRERRKTAVFLRPEDAPAVVVLQRENQLDRDRFHLVGVGMPAGAPGVDEVLGTPAPESQATLDARVDVLMALTPAERWDFWREQLARCTRCHACRQACPICTCERCIVERNQPAWIPPSPHGLGGWTWNWVRAYHLAGRCIGCGECARACPEGIPMDLLNHHLVRRIREDYGFEAGADPADPILLAHHQKEDPEDFLGSGS